jgi:hypothetical protein
VPFCPTEIIHGLSWDKIKISATEDVGFEVFTAVIFTDNALLGCDTLQPCQFIFRVELGTS